MNINNTANGGRGGEENGGYSNNERENRPDLDHGNNNLPVNMSTPEKDKKHNNNNNNDDDDEEEEEEVDISCGIWKFRTSIFGKWFSNLYMFSLLMGISALFTMMVNQVINIHLTSLERQFNIDNTQAGFFDTTSKIGFMCTVLLAGHFAKRTHIPILVGTAGVIQGLVLLIPSILQFADPYELPVLSKSGGNESNSTSDNSKYICNAQPLEVNNDTDVSTKPDEPVNRLAYNVILVVMVLKGIAESFHSGFLPSLYIDDNLEDKTKMGIFLGVYGVFQDLAIPLGKEINGILSEIPIDLKETDMEPKDRRFVAAWWLAFLILGTGTAVFSFPLILFPRKLVSKRKQKEALAKALVTFAGGQVEDEDVKRPEVDQANDYDTIKPPAIVVTSEMNQKEGSYRRYSLPQSDRVRKLSLQPDSVSGSRKSSLQLPGEGRTERKVSITGDMVFEQPVKLGKDGLLKEQSVIELIKDFPKAMLRVLKIPAFTLILLDIAIIAIPTSGTMMFKSMYMANEYNVKMSEVAMASGVSTAVGNIGGTILSSAISSRLHTKVGYVWLILGTYAFMTAIAPLAIVFGCDNVGVYGAQGDIGVFQNISSLSCDCSEVGQLISCGDDGRNYYSPCYAGCSGVDGKEFTDCSLLANGTTGDRVTPGLCDVDCHDNFIVYTFIHGAQFMANSMGNIPKRLLVMRIVQPQDRGFGTSMFMFFYYLVSVPSPNVFGKVIDGTCLIWDDGYCSLYDRNSIRNFMAGVDAGVQGTVLISMFAMLAIFYYELKKTKAKSQQPDKDMNVKDAEMDVPEPIRNKEPQFESVRL